MRRALSLAALTFVLGGAVVAVVCVPRAGAPVGALPPGTVIEVELPTGQMVTGAGGSGDPQPVMAKHRFRVLHQRGEQKSSPGGACRVTIGSTTYVCVPAE